MDWTSSSRCEVMKLRLALLGMNIDLSQGSRSQPPGGAPPPVSSSISSRDFLEEFLEIYEWRMLNTDVLVREQGDVLTGGDGATVKM